MLNIGILQGRLSPSPDGRFQFFPSDWQKEFQEAARLGFNSIEWLFDWPDWQTNPIIDPQMERKIRQTVEETGVYVNSICADYFMKYRFTGSDASTSSDMCILLVRAAAQLTKQKLILIPFLEQNAYGTEKEQVEVIKHLKPAVRMAEQLGVRIGLETEMPVPELSQFLNRFQSEAIGVYYDIGNCTSYGFDCPSDIKFLNKSVFGIHIKDRKVGSANSVFLGKGDANLDECFKVLHALEFQGSAILQAWRGENYIQDAEQQLRFMKQLTSWRMV